MVSIRGIVIVVALASLVVQPVAAAVPTAAGRSDFTPPIDGNGVAQASGVPTETVHPPDPGTDVLGWENGYWYNETIDVTQSDGLNDAELDAVLARSMARVERIRRLEFAATPPVAVISRDEFRGIVESRLSNLTDAERRRRNVVYEALFMIDESTDATAVLERSLGGFIGAFYDPRSGTVKLIVTDTGRPRIDERTLAEELFHALQDQRFDVSSFNQSTLDRRYAGSGLIEGDAKYVTRLYEQRCEDEWPGGCVVRNQTGSSDADVHPGYRHIRGQPYSDGPPFVRRIRKEGGLAAVNALYADPPVSTEQVIHPAKYGVDEPTNPSVPDRSNDEWRRLDVEGGVDHASVGEAGLYVMLWYPARDADSSGSVIPLQEHYNEGPDGQLRADDPFDYDHRYTAGWDGDTLVPYVTNASTSTNETGYVYRTVWDSPADAAEFRKAYEELLTIHGAKSVDGRAATYRIPDDEPFDDAWYLNRTGETVTIVNAPSVESLAAVHRGAAPGSAGPTGPLSIVIVLGTAGLALLAVGWFVARHR